MTNYYKATFSTGRTIVRSSARKYTHAYLVPGDGTRFNYPYSEWGFSKSADHARKASKGLGEVVPTVEIAAKEYRVILGWRWD
jgi:hypothetical protein